MSVGLSRLQQIFSAILPGFLGSFFTRNSNDLESTFEDLLAAEPTNELTRNIKVEDPIHHLVAMGFNTIQAQAAFHQAAGDMRHALRLLLHSDEGSFPSPPPPQSPKETSPKSKHEFEKGVYDNQHKKNSVQGTGTLSSPSCQPSTGAPSHIQHASGVSARNSPFANPKNDSSRNDSPEIWTRHQFHESQVTFTPGTVQTGPSKTSAHDWTLSDKNDGMRPSGTPNVSGISGQIVSSAPFTAFGPIEEFKKRKDYKQMNKFIEALAAGANVVDLTLCNITEDEELPDRFWQAMLENDAVERLKLVAQESPCEEFGWDRMCAYLGKTKSLRVLELPGNDLGHELDGWGAEENLRTLRRALMENVSLTSLNLADNYLCKDVRRELMKALRQKTQLHSLNLCGSKFSCRQVEELLQLPLVELLIQGAEIGDAGCKLLHVALSKARLTKLDIRSNGITHIGCKDLAHAIMINKSLLSLDLSENSLGSGGWELLAMGLKWNGTLQELRLAKTCGSSKGLEELAGYLADNRVLSTLDLGSNDLGNASCVILQSLLEKNAGLTYLSLADNHIAQYGAEEVAKGILRNKSLKDINLSGNAIQKQCPSFMKLAQNISNPLVNISLANTQLTAFDIQKLDLVFLEKIYVKAFNLEDPDETDEPRSQYAKNGPLPKRPKLEDLESVLLSLSPPCSCLSRNEQFDRYLGHKVEMVKEAGDKPYKTMQARTFLKKSSCLSTLPLSQLGDYEVDHIIPFSLGGPDHPFNYFLCPKSLNRYFKDDIHWVKRAYIGKEVFAKAKAFANFCTVQTEQSTHYSKFDFDTYCHRKR